MGFELVERGEWQSSALQSGFATLDRTGKATFLVDDLELAGVTVESGAAVVADPETLRVGVRAPRDEEKVKAFAVSVVKGHRGKESQRRAILLSRALRRLGLDPEACRGRYELTTKDNMLILSVAGVEGPTERAATATAARGAATAATTRPASPATGRPLATGSGLAGARQR